ncbi:uncharacterized protein K02A2.6-like [Cydia pomonella]|uniref:uncharacterized protein K02A2.6-like n=1 Tax=Cydia pomonella TaxID=82600 RepID=UPI002ADDFD3C|nr:uncharacterized protein K02A2.6-like [Cydia pomonella]
MSVGKLKEFDVRNGQWASFVDRLEMYFLVNDIAEDRRLPTLIATMGDEAYELLVNLASPKKPSTLTYSQVVELMRQHLQPKPSALAERYRFRQKRQGINEDVTSYVAELKKMSRHCEFGESLSDNLRDQFICGLRNDVIRQRLFAEDDTITFVEAVKLACSLEAAEKDAAAVEGSTTAAAGAVHALAAAAERGQRARASGQARAAGAAAEKVRADNCAACGARNHGYGTCRFRDFVCSKCQRTGHLRRVCPEYSAPGAESCSSGCRHGRTQKKKGFNFGEVDSGSDEDEFEERLNHLGLDKYPPVCLPISIDNKIIKMEIDTGTAIACVSRATYNKKFSHLPIERDSTVLRFYNGSKVKPMGIVRPTVRYLDREKKLELFVIEDGTTSLIGRQWLTELKIKLPDFSVDLDIHNCQIQIDEDICNLLDRYSEVFSGGLGRYLGGKATLRVREGATPVFRRARPMPYALRERVDAELDAMLRENIIEPVDCSEWASPLVPVNKADEVKKALTSTNVLAHYDPKKTLIVTCDASARGVGGVLAQPGPTGERPVAYASRSLTSAEKNYSQIHREALAIIYCMKKFHQYLYGRKFVLRTDHKPLVSIFGPNAGIPTMTASRMQRWAVILSAYDYEIEYIKTNENCAHGLSRLPPGADTQASAAEVVPEQTYLHFVQDALLLDYSELKRLTAEDNILQRLLSFIRDGWPETCEILAMKPYFNRKSELYEELGCVMWGHRLVVPEGCRKQILDLIHEPHMGVVKSKALARSYVWWPGIDEALERKCLACTVCAAHADDPPRATPRSWGCPAQAWSRLHLDFMGPIAGKTYLVAVDATSKWLEVFPVPSTAAKFTINRLSELFSRFGNPRQVVTDNGPPFTSSEFIGTSSS